MARRVTVAGPAARASFAAVVEGRASGRRYLTDPVPRADVERMVALATRAARAGNAQSWRFVAAKDPEIRRRMRAAVDAKLDEMAAWPEAAGLQSELRAVQLLIAATHALGYGACWMSAPVVVCHLLRCCVFADRRRSCSTFPQG